MCCYCVVGDHFFRHDPPWRDDIWPAPFPIPRPINPAPTPPWDITRLVELYDMLKCIKALEDQLGCPCEPNKADYIALLKERIDNLEKAAAKSPKTPL